MTRLFITGTDKLIAPPEWLDQSLGSLLQGVRVLELVVPGLTSTSNCAYGWAAGVGSIRTFKLEPNAKLAAEYCDLAIFVWDGKDSHTTLYRNWFHYLNKQYRDLVIPEIRDYRY